MRLALHLNRKKSRPKKCRLILLKTLQRLTTSCREILCKAPSRYKQSMDSSLRNPSFPSAGDALVVIDVQRDFLSGGALAVPHAEEIVPGLNRYIQLFALKGLPIFATRDWHPANHCSFREQGGPWPMHCVMGSAGAEFSPELQLPPHVEIISKASDPSREAYSDFADTNFEVRLRELQIRRLFVGGLATEYCVLATVRDALAKGFGVMLLIDAIRPINVQTDDGRRAEQEMIRLGAAPLRWDELKMTIHN